MLGTPTVNPDNNQHKEQACSTNRNISIDEWKIEEKLEIRTQRWIEEKHDVHLVRSWQ